MGPTSGAKPAAFWQPRTGKGGFSKRREILRGRVDTIAPSVQELVRAPGSLPMAIFLYRVDSTVLPILTQESVIPLK